MILSVLKEWIILSLFADGGIWAVTGNDLYLVGEGQESVADGVDELTGISSGEIGAADRACEEGIASNQKRVLR